jgi:tetratricopeptide (TPR) repeat protein
MTFEQQLIQKNFYKNFGAQNELQQQPILRLANLLLHPEEELDESSIRFAQGEVYFENNDYETAIFKWSKVNNELKDWATKNIADSYFEQNIYSVAEETYKSIKPESPTLKSEIYLQLFSLFGEQNKNQFADQVIKEAVKFNPDYPNVTNFAREFYEEQEDFKSAIELAVNESIRTEELSWYRTLTGYIRNGWTIEWAPTFFVETLISLARVDYTHFEEMVEALWNSYEQEEVYISWLDTFNQTLFQINVETGMEWGILPSLYENTYRTLIEGRYLFEDIKEMLPNFLANWLRITDGKGAIFAATSTLAWNEQFPSSLESTLVKDAQELYQHIQNSPINIEELKFLYVSLLDWAMRQNVELNDSFMNTNKNVDQYLVDSKDIINSLIETRIEKENELLSLKEWNEVLDQNLNSQLHTLKDREMDHIQKISNAYSDMKVEIMYELKLGIPGILRECSTMVKEDSDFSTILEDINHEMNVRIHRYLEETILPKLNASLLQWIDNSGIILNSTQEFIAEICHSINEYMREERLVLEGDMKLLEDWRRDVDRMTSLVQLEEIDILIQSSPSQFILKSTGGLFGLFSKASQVAQYQKHIDGINYDEVSSTIISKFFLQYEMFEKSLQRDILLFLRSPYQYLHELVDETRNAIYQYSTTLGEMKAKPELFFDPINFYSVRVIQQELIRNKN